MRLSELDVSVKPIRSKDLSEERIIGAINEMQQVYDEKRKKAEEISKKIQAEGGVDKAVELITHAIMSQECS